MAESAVSSSAWKWGNLAGRGEGTHISAGRLYRDRVRFMGSIGACASTLAGRARLLGEGWRRVGVESDEDGRGS